MGPVGRGKPKDANLLALLLVLFLLAAIWVAFRPPVAVAIVLCMFSIEQLLQTTIPYFGQHRPAANLFVAGLAAEALIVALFRRQLVLFRHYPRVGWVIMALFAFAFISGLWTMYVPGWKHQWISQGPYVLLMMISIPLLVYDERSFRTALVAMLVVGIFIVPLLLFKGDWFGRSLRVAGTGGLAWSKKNLLYANELANTATRVLLIIVLMNFRGVSRWLTLLRWPLVVLCLMLIVKAQSRGALAGGILAAIVMLPISRQLLHQRRVVSVLFGVSVLAMLSAFVVMQLATQKRWNLQDMWADMVGVRIARSVTVLDTCLEGGPVRWVVGIGQGAAWSPQVVGDMTEMVYAETLAEEGMIGFALLVIVMVMTARAVVRCARATVHMPSARAIVATLGALALFDFLLMGKAHTLLGSVSAFTFAIMLGRFECWLRDQAAAYPWLAYSTGQPMLPSAA